MTIETTRRGFLGSALGGVVGMSAISAGATPAANRFDPVPLDEAVSLWDLPTPALVVDVEALEGLQAYAGHVQHQNGWEYRRKLSEATMGRAVEIRRLIEKEGFEVGILSGGGIGTYDIDSEIEGMTDAQVGSYLFMDVDYRGIGGRDSAVFDDFRPSLLVLATAISQPAKGRITIDAGYKAFATDQDPPQLLDIQGVSYRWGGDEHGILQFKEPSRGIEIGDKVLLIAPHCDPTVNLYDHYYPYRDERVSEKWPIAARGRSQ